MPGRETAASALQIQAQLDYTREHEREADRVGLTLLERAGFDPRGMGAFFERMLRANRLSEFKGAPVYLRTHPLTTERIADMQDRIQQPVFRMSRADGFEYRLIRSKLRAATGSPSEAVTYFRTALADKTVVRPREDVYGLVLALRRTRDFEAAWSTLEPLRQGDSHPAFERLAADLFADQGRTDDALGVYRAALKKHPGARALVHGYLGLQMDKGRAREVLADLDERLRRSSDDPRLYELQARAYEAVGGRSRSIAPRPRHSTAGNWERRCSARMAVRLRARTSTRPRSPSRDCGSACAARDRRAAEKASAQLMRRRPDILAVRWRTLAWRRAQSPPAPPAFVQRDKGNCVACHQVPKAPAGHARNLGHALQAHACASSAVRDCAR